MYEKFLFFLSLNNHIFADIESNINLKLMNSDINKRAADNIRILSMAMVEKSRSGHPGGAMGGADFIHILFSEFLNFDPD
jgi:transketolase N-terminal domain/subunit